MERKILKQFASGRVRKSDVLKLAQETDSKKTFFEYLSGFSFEVCETFSDVARGMGSPDAYATFRRKGHATLSFKAFAFSADGDRLQRHRKQPVSTSQQHAIVADDGRI